MKHQRETEIRAWCDDEGEIRKGYQFVRELLGFISGLRASNITLNRLKESYQEASDRWMKSGDKYQALFDETNAKLEFLIEYLKTNYKCIGLKNRHINGNCLHCFAKYFMFDKQAAKYDELPKI